MAIQSDRVNSVYNRRTADAVRAVEIRLSDLFSEVLKLPRMSSKGREHLTMLQWEALSVWLAEKKSKTANCACGVEPCVCTPPEIVAEVPKGLTIEGADAEVEIGVDADAPVTVPTVVEDSGYERALIGVENYEPTEADPEADTADDEPLLIADMSAEASEAYIRYNGTAHKHLMREVQVRGLAGRLPIPEKGNYVRKDHLIHLLMENDGYALP